MLSSYQDSYTMWHDRVCFEGKPRSNNSFIYTAYSKYLASNTFIFDKVTSRFQKCLRNKSPLVIDRLPNKRTPPQSKDEIIGMVSLGLLSSESLTNSHWNFCNLEYVPEKLNFRKVFNAIKIILSIRKEHRNYAWENELTEVYCLLFYLPPWDQYYVMKMCGKSPTLFQTLAFFANLFFTIVKGNRSVRMLLWLQMSDMYPRLAKLLPKKKWVKAYFREGHPFRENL